MRNRMIVCACAAFAAAAIVSVFTDTGPQAAPTSPSERREVITDFAGRQVALPARVDRVISPFMMYTRIIVALGAQDKLVGISHTCVLPEEEHPHGKNLLDLPDVGDFGENIELMASLKPDVIFSFPQSIRTFEEKTGATVIGASLPQGVPLEEMFERQIDLIGRSLRKEKEAADLNAFIKAKLRKVTDITSRVLEGERPKVYFAWTSWTGDITNTVVDFDTIELAGGINVARGCRNFAKGQRGILVSKEHIINWNPDVIFLSRYESFKWQKTAAGKKAPVTIEEVLADPLLQNVNAVKNRRVYYTTAFCNWWPHQRAIAQVFQMAKIFYPDKFKGLDVEREGNEVFKKFYGQDGQYSRMARNLELYTGE